MHCLSRSWRTAGLASSIMLVCRTRRLVPLRLLTLPLNIVPLKVSMPHAGHSRLRGSQLTPQGPKICRLPASDTRKGQKAFKVCPFRPSELPDWACHIPSYLNIAGLPAHGQQLIMTSMTSGSHLKLGHAATLPKDHYARQSQQHPSWVQPHSPASRLCRLLSCSLCSK